MGCILGTGLGGVGARGRWQQAEGGRWPFGRQALSPHPALASQPGGGGASRASVGASSHGTGGILHPPGMPSTSEDLHAWSIYRQNLNVSINSCLFGFF